MDMSSHSSDSAGHMVMTFFESQTTPLYSTSWTPSSAGAYAGTCIFLVILASASRCLFAFKAVLEQRWLAQARNRRYVLVKGKGTEAEKIESDPAAKVGALITTNGVEEKVKIVRSDARGVVPFRLSVDVPRAALAVVMAGVGYLLQVPPLPPLLD
jgi:Ctr copper transporter family